MRLIKIQDDPPYPGVERVTYYNPEIHKPEAHHYMSHPWRARFHYTMPLEDGSVAIESYWLYGAFGNPGSLIRLTNVETLDG
jgi:hypothetical protein